jgi:hypothetical protein
MSDFTRICSAVEQGDAGAANQLVPLVYGELRRIASQKLAQEKPGQTLSATALVHEAYVRLVDLENGQCWNSRSHSDKRIHFPVAGWESNCDGHLFTKKTT